MLAGKIVGEYGDSPDGGGGCVQNWIFLVYCFMRGLVDIVGGEQFGVHLLQSWPMKGHIVSLSSEVVLGDMKGLR
jgi:hypothetical protein